MTTVASEKGPAGTLPGSASVRDFLLPLLMLGILVVLLVPLPPVLLDMLLATNLGFTVILMLATLSVRRSMEMSVFPSLLLLLTLFRLSLNVATTRLILIDGSAGKIVSTFGSFVVGGNLVVGLVIFLILIIVQFIVITKGAGRVSEVAARFTLDALPGKQMAIDAELNAGSINDVKARVRRAELATETEFYGAMDGASKFVRGDAVASLIVTGINLVGGIILGVSSGLSITQAATRYSILTVGDGLVSQIPALIIATSAGILVTKTSSDLSLGNEIGAQLFRKKNTMYAGAGILFLLALTPGLPKIPFIGLALAAAIFGRKLSELPDETTDEEDEAPEPLSADDELANGFVIADRVCVEVGAKLVQLVDSQSRKGLAERIPKLRRELTRKNGIWVPAIRICDNLQLGAEEYRLLINGREVSKGTVRPDQYLVINPGDISQELDGEMTIEPTFGLPAMWLTASKRQRAELAGRTVVDPTSVIITHLGEVLSKYAHELLSRGDLQHLLDRLRTVSPAIVEELKPDLLRVSTLHQVLVLLLKEKIPVCDLNRILECTLSHAVGTKDPLELSELLRKDLGRSICQPFCDDSNRVRVLLLAPPLQSRLRNSLHQGDLVLHHTDLERMLSSIQAELNKAQLSNEPFALLADDLLRRPLRNCVERSLPDLAIIAFGEIPTDLMIEQVAMLETSHVFSASDGDPVSLFPSADDAATNRHATTQGAA